MDGYYDHHPLVSLDEHLVLAGYLADETRLVGYQVASLTGLPVTDLDRKIEHHAGKSIWDLIWSEGEERYRRLEKRYLSRLLAAKPYGIVSLGDGALIDDGNRELVLAESSLVVFDLDLPNCYWRLQSSPAVDENAWHPLYPQSLRQLEQLRPFFELREPGFRRAHHRIEARGKKRAELVESVIELL